MNKQLKGSLQLTLTALIWGIAFVAQSVGMDYVGPYTFNCVRYYIGAIVLIPVVIIIKKIDANSKAANNSSSNVLRPTIKGGIICGILLSVATLLQQFGIMYSSVGKAGFITALYIIIVPFLSIFLKKKLHANAWISACIACVGFYIMSISGKPSIEGGDIYLLACAFMFSLQIMVVDHYVENANPVLMSLIQFATCATVCGIGMLAFEAPQLSNILAAYVPILYTGVLSSGVAYTLQIVGQRNVEATLASLIMSLESVFAALAGWFILKVALESKEIIGCVLVFIAIIIAQIPAKADKNN